MVDRQREALLRLVEAVERLLSADLVRGNEPPSPETENDFRLALEFLHEVHSDFQAAPTGRGEREGWMSCYDCGRPYGDEHGFPDLAIPNEQWRKISPTGDGGGLLCPSCICHRLHGAGIRDCPGAFVSGPIKSVDPDLMQTIRWLENTREEMVRKGMIDDPTQPPVPEPEKASAT